VSTIVDLLLRLTAQFLVFSGIFESVLSGMVVAERVE